VIVGVLAGSCAHAPRAERWVPPGDQPVRASAATLKIEGLHCPLCAAQLEKALVSTPGVERADVDAAAGIVRVRFQGVDHPSGSDLAHAVADAGFRLKGIGR